MGKKLEKCLIFLTQIYEMVLKNNPDYDNIIEYLGFSKMEVLINAISGIRCY